MHARQQTFSDDQNGDFEIRVTRKIIHSNFIPRVFHISSHISLLSITTEYIRIDRGLLARITKEGRRRRLILFMLRVLLSVYFYPDKRGGNRFR